jgi:predicted TIM-barrel fold metal-dependent hydrolase
MAAWAEIHRLRVADGPDPAINELVTRAGLIDHHVHSIVRGPVSHAGMRQMLSESDRASAAEAGGFDSQVAVALRRWCAPLLGLPAAAPMQAYLERREALGDAEVAARLLPHAGVEQMLIDTGFRSRELLPLDELGALAGAETHVILRLESLAEEVATSGVSAGGFATAFRAALDREAVGAIGLKSIVAYRAGLDFDPTPPTAAEVERAAGEWLRHIEVSGSRRLVDAVLLRFVLWEGAATGKPLQIHTGYGDTDLDLHRCDPLLLTGFLRATEGRCQILLLHTYPYHRQAGYLTQMFAHVSMDVGLAINYAGAQATQLIAESLELAPFTKVLYSSDAWGLPELHLLGSWLFRRGMARVLGAWVERGDWSVTDGERVMALVSAGNARRVYGLPPPA